MIIETKSHGDVEVWQEARFPREQYLAEEEVWAARAIVEGNRPSLGYGENPGLAIISALEGVEMIRQADYGPGADSHPLQEIVDKLSERKAPKFPGTVGRWTSAEEMPVGTVIRIKGPLHDGAYGGFVFEKASDSRLPWITTGSEVDYNPETVQSAIDNKGYDLLYVPGAS